MTFRENCAVSLLSPTSMGLRITPADRQPVHVSTLYTLQATSAETNVLSISAALGLRTKALTAFVEDSPMSLFIQGDLRRRGISYEGPTVPQGGPWGYRHQFNIADSGFGARGPRVHNDRAGEVGRTLRTEDFDLERIFRREGVQILHLSGLIAALSPQSGEFCLALARMARECGTRVSFDINYRASFWKNREAELRAVFTELAQLSDVLIGNGEDFELALGVPASNAGGEMEKRLADSQKMLLMVRERFPAACVYATALRESLSANSHLWGALVCTEGRFFTAQPREVPVLDRIGGGDAFVGGMLYGILRGWEPEKWVDFGWGCGAYALTTLTDYCLPADEDQIWSICRGNARVRR